MMRIVFIFVIVVLFCTCSTNVQMINNSSNERVTQQEFEKCILNSNYENLLGRKDKKDKVYFEYFPEVKNEVSCDGIYFYRYVSRSMPQLLYRDSKGQAYSKYFLFAIQNGEIINLSNKNLKWKEKFFNGNRDNFLKWGNENLIELRSDIIRGSKDFY